MLDSRLAAIFVAGIIVSGVVAYAALKIIIPIDANAPATTVTSGTANSSSSDDESSRDKPDVGMEGGRKAKSVTRNSKLLKQQKKVRDKSSQIIISD